MDNDIFHKFTHKFIPITTIYDQLPNKPSDQIKLGKKSHLSHFKSSFDNNTL